MPIDHNIVTTQELFLKDALNTLLPYGLLATRKWLRQQGLAIHAIDNALKSKKLLPLANGVYCQYSTKLTWHGVTASYQRIRVSKLSELPDGIVGGISALELSGFGHYISAGKKKTIHLHSVRPLPSWLRRLKFDFEFKQHNSCSLWSSEVIKSAKFLKHLDWQPELPSVLFSCPEKAILEVLNDVPKTVSFEHADELMQGLVNLSPRKLNILLQECQSIKVKRLFLWFSGRHRYPWFNRIDIEKIELGTGKRVIEKSGKLDPELQITVPAHMVN